MKKSGKHKVKKKNKKQKGFSMVELLAVIAILGIISLIGVVSISRILDNSRRHYYQTQQEQMVLAAQSYVQDNRSVLPKNIGQLKKITLEELMNKKYIKDKIVDQNKQACDIKTSYVDVYKYSKTDYSYTAYLECPACKKGNDSKCYGEDSEVEPNIEIKIDDVSGNDLLKDTDKDNNINITYKPDNSNNDSGIKIASYSYKIYVDGKLIKSSGVKINNRKGEKTIKEPLRLYVPGRIKVVATVTNTKGKTKTATKTKDLSDAVSPLCGKVTYEGNNIMKSYESKDIDNIKCGSNDYSWINTSKSNEIRQAWLKCDDQKGLGCRQREISTLLNTDGEDERVTIYDTKGNKTNCTIKKCIDKTNPKIDIKIYNSNNNNRQAKYSYSINKTENNTIDKWFNKIDYPNGIYIEVIASDKTSKLKEFEWKQNEDLVEKKTWSLNKTVDSHSQEISIEKNGEIKEIIKVTDYAGNTITYTLTLKIDRSPPECDVTNSGGTLGNNNWYKGGTVTATGTCTDNGPSGCANTTIEVQKVSSDSSSSSGTSANKPIYDKAGNSATCSSTIKYDKSAPRCDVTNSGGTLGNNNWYKGGTVTATGTCTDNGKSGCINTTIEVQKVSSDSSSSSGTSANKTIYDNAGNNATCSSTIKYDKSAPRCDVTNSGGTLGNNNWYKGGTVTATGTCTDNGQSGCVNTTTEVQKVNSNSSSSSGTSANKTIYDKAGNSVTCSSTIKYDKTKPVIKATKMHGLNGTGTYVVDSGCDTETVKSKCSSTFKTTGTWFYEAEYWCEDSLSGCVSGFMHIWNHNGPDNTKCGKKEKTYAASTFVSNCAFGCAGSCTKSWQYIRVVDKAGNYGYFKFTSVLKS